MKAGDKVTWAYTPRGGYGYVYAVPARVVKVGPKKVQIAAQLARGGERLVWVDLKNLRERK